MFGFRPLMTRYEFCLLCADSYETKGDTMMRDIYRKLMSEMTVEEAGRSV